MRHLRTSLQHVCVAVGADGNGNGQRVIAAAAHSVRGQLLVPLHHHLKVLVNLVVFRFGARRQRVTVVGLGRFW